MAWTEKRGPGKYRGGYRDSSGNLLYLPGTFTHKAEAQRKANAAEEKARARASTVAGHLWTWGRWRDEWLEGRAVEASTAKVDAGRIAKYLTPQWEVVRLNAITRNDVKKWAKQLRAGKAPGCTNGKKVSAATTQRIVHLFSASLTAAVDDEMIEVNPAYRLKLAGGEQALERYLEHEEFEALLAQLPSTYDQLVAKMLVYTGLRWGELAGLHWNRVDLNRGFLRVVETWSEAGREIKPCPKGRRIRDVPIPGWLVEELRQLPVAIGGCGHPHQEGACRSALVLTTEHGHVLHHSKWSALWRRAVEDAGIGHARIHDLRHTYASWLLQSGEYSLAEIGKLLGHVDPKTTQRYAHLETKTTKDVSQVLPAPNLLPAAGGEHPPPQVRRLGKVKGQRSHTPD